MGIGVPTQPLLIFSTATVWVAMAHRGSTAGASRPSLLPKTMPLAPEFSCWRYQRNCKEHSARAPQEWEVVGGQGWGRLAAAAGRRAKAAAEGSEACLRGLVHGTYSSAGLRLRPRPRIPFPRKNAAEGVLFCFLAFFLLFAGGLGMEPCGGVLGKRSEE